METITWSRGVEHPAVSGEFYVRLASGRQGWCARTQTQHGLLSCFEGQQIRPDGTGYAVFDEQGVEVTTNG